MSSEENKLLSQATLDNTEEFSPSFTKCKLLKVYDGDTFWVAGVVGKKVYQFRVRLYGIDTPEMKGGTLETKAKAKEAKNYVARYLGKIVDIEILSGSKNKDRYGRMLAKIKVDGNDLTEELIKAGHGIAYYGGNKEEALKRSREIIIKS